MCVCVWYVCMVGVYVYVFRMCVYTCMYVYVCARARVHHTIPHPHHQTPPPTHTTPKKQVGYSNGAQRQRFETRYGSSGGVTIAVEATRDKVTMIIFAYTCVRWFGLGI